MSKSAVALLVAILCAPAVVRADARPAPDGARVGPTRQPTRVADADDEEDDEEDDDDDDATADDDDDDRPAKKAWRGKRAKPATDDDEDDEDDAATDDDDDDAPVKKKPKKRKKPAVDDDDDDADDDDDDAASDDDGDDAPVKKKPKKRKKPAVADDDDDDDDGDDDDDTAAADDDDDRPARKPKKKRKKAKRPAEPVVEEAPVEQGPHVVQEVYITPPKVIVAGELLGARPIDGVNGDLFGMGGGVGVGLEYYLSPALAVHASVSYLYLRQGDGMSTTSWASGQLGPRLHLGGKVFGASTHHDAWLDAHVGYGSSGGIRRPGFDVGGAIQWEVSPALRVGPMVRWAFGSDPLDKNAQLLTIGLAVGVGGRTRHTIHIEGDADGDGLIDRLDECPGELPGETPDAERPGCPSRDADGDGVLDDDDECPEEAAGDDPDAGRVGCPAPPVLDRDKDTVIDDQDRCPDEPGAARPGEPTNGCPLARVQDQKIEILEQIFFENDSATISESSGPVLESLGKVIGSLGEVHISIEGHTDEVGTDGYNMDLSKRRARAVAQWLVENAGIATTRLEVKGWGKRRPLVSGKGADTSKNRRVEFLILEAK